MRFVEYGVLSRTVGTAGAFVVLLVLTLGAVRAADDKIYVMKITLPTVNDSTYQFAKNYAAAIERDSGGRIKAEVYNASQLQRFHARKA
jgi:TRAP-type C4-dicarboxylate transport system substrate-binding protein